MSNESFLEEYRMANAESKLIVLNDLWKQFREELKTKYNLEQTHLERLDAFINEYQDLQYEIGYYEGRNETKDKN